jgi:trans-aconitate methyltransferase
LSDDERHTLDEQRLAFGRVAELYDRARPSYPATVIDEVIGLAAVAPPARILEIGAGTGKLTTLLAQRGFGVLAIEPDAAMARVARANCARHPAVEIVETAFEAWTPAGRFPLLVCAAAWHWLAPEVRFTRAAQALAPGALLAAIWTFPDWRRCAARATLADAYRRAAPEMAPDFPMHPASRPAALAGDWRSDVEAAAGFTGAAISVHAWTQTYTGEQYAMLLGTHQDHILLAPAERERLLDAIARAIDGGGGGGTLTMPFATRICVATRVQDEAIDPSRPQTGQDS